MIEMNEKRKAKKEEGKKKQEDKEKQGNKEKVQNILDYIEGTQVQTAKEVKQVMNSNLPKKKKKEKVNDMLDKVGLTRKDVLKLQEKGII